MTSPLTLLRLMQLTDSMFPMGAFVHSNGLETYTDAKAVRSIADLKALIKVRLEAAGESDLVFVKEALQAAENSDLAELLELDEMLSAFRTAYEARLASIKVGRQLLRMATTLFDDPLPVAAVDTALVLRCLEPHWAVKAETMTRVRQRVEAVRDDVGKYLKTLE